MVDRSFNPQDLLVLARDNNAAAIEHAVKYCGADIRFKNRIGQSALHIAAIQGAVAAIKKLIELGLEPNVQNDVLQTPLHFAAGAHRNVLETVNTLLERGADPFAVDKFGRLPYECAGKNEEVRFLLGGPDPRLFTAAAAGDVATLRALFIEDPSMDACQMSGDGCSPIHLAAQGGHIGALNFLLQRDGAEPNQHDVNTGDTPLHLAVKGNHISVLELLHRREADVNAKNFQKSAYAKGGWTSNGEDLGPLHQAPLHVAVEQGNEEIVAKLLSMGADPNIGDFDGRTPLHYALEVQDVDLAVALLKGGADAKKGCPDFATPLHLSAQQGDVDGVRALLQYGADVDAADAQGWTPVRFLPRNFLF